MTRRREIVKNGNDKITHWKSSVCAYVVPPGHSLKGKGDERVETMTQSAGHKITLTDRTRLEVTGVEEVESFDESTIIMSTSRGELIVRGEGLHIETLSLDGGALKVDGTVESLTYEDKREDAGGLWSRLFR